MLKYFKKYTFSSLFISAFLLIILWLLPIIKTDASISFDGAGVIFLKLFGNSEATLFTKLLAFVIFSVEAIFFIVLTIKYDFLRVKTYLPGLIYVIFTGYFYVQEFSPVLLANLFFVPVYFIITSTVYHKKSLHHFFTAGFLLALSSLIYFPYAFMLIPIMLSVIVIRSQLTKEIFSVVAGFLVVFILFNEIYFLKNKEVFDSSLFFSSLTVDVKKLIITDLPTKIYWIFTILVFVLSNFKILSSYRTKEIEKRTIFQLNFLFFLSLLAMFVGIPSVNYSLLVTIAMPVSVLIADYFIESRETRFLKILFVIFVIFPLIFEIIELF